VNGETNNQSRTIFMHCKTFKNVRYIMPTFEKARSGNFRCVCYVWGVNMKNMNAISKGVEVPFFDENMHSLNKGIDKQ
jgi:hypothetical protein